MIPEALIGSSQPLLIAVDRNMPELITFAFNRNESNTNSTWGFTKREDGNYQISNIGKPRGELFALGVVVDGIYDQLAMAEIIDVGAQKWQVVYLENGYCRLTTELLGPDVALTVVNDTQQPRLTMAPVSNNPGQHWRLDSLYPGPGMLQDNQVELCDDDLKTPFEINS